MPTRKNQALTQSPQNTLISVNQHKLRSLSDHIHSVLQFKRQKLKQSLAEVLLHVYAINEMNRRAYIANLEHATGHAYNRLAERLSYLHKCGYLSRNVVYSRHGEEHTNLKFRYHTYSVTDAGVRYLMDIFCKPEDI